MNIGDFILSFNTFDLLVVLVLFAMFILGFIQGTIRRLLGIASIAFSFLLAANLREPLGAFLAREWTHLPNSYAVMVGFGTVFVAASVAFAIAIQGFYKKIPLFDRYTFVDEVLGGLLGVLQGVLILVAMVVILDTGFRQPGVPVSANELPFLRELFTAYNDSVTASILREGLIPSLFVVLGLFIPDEVKAFFPVGGSPAA